MRRIALALLAVAGLALTTEAQCPVQSIAFSEFGQGAGLFPGAPPVMKIALDTATCSLEFKMDVFACCNTFVSQSFLAVGTMPLSTPLPLPRPFVAGAQLFVQPDLILGPFTGTAGSVPLPMTPGIVGATVFLQGAPIYFTTIGLTFDFGVTQAFKVLFQ